ncbi:MAG: STAS domain-containing protein [Lachnospiraceae bacterium]|nr:STAS domain-containing protein [Lachnospiraceae bacterium]
MKKMINIDGNTLTVNVEKPLTAVESADLEGKLRVSANDPAIKTVYIDLNNVEYISSAGLRVFLSMHRYMEEREGKLILKNVNDEVMGTLKLTGFDKVLNIE